MSTARPRRARAKTSAELSNALSSTGVPRRFLIVDDNPGLVTFLSRSLKQKFGAVEVYTVGSCAEANIVLKKKKIDFALLDYMLPDGNGIELGVRIRERFGANILVMCGTILPPEEEALCEEFDMPALRKPFYRSDLLNVIEGWMTGRHVGPAIFIGHGRSQEWKDLRHFLTTRLHLTCDEFNSDSAAGIATVTRLEQMLKNAHFAFLVMTSEDVHSDGSVHARENVIHEAGLFQGKLGFERAIILMEEGCTGFSNIHGLTHISFPKGRLEAAFEQIRQVLERERLIPAGKV